MLKSKPAARHSGRRAIATPKRITQSDSSAQKPASFTDGQIMRAQEPVSDRLFCRWTSRARSRRRAISRFDLILTPCTCRTDRPNARANFRITRSSGETFQQLLMSLRSSVNELRCFNGFRLASGVSLATSTGRSGLIVDAISTAAAPVMNVFSAKVATRTQTRPPGQPKA